MFRGGIVTLILILSMRLTHGALVHEAPLRSDTPVEALGLESGMWGSQGQGIEAWVYPFKLFDSLSFAISHDEGRTFQPLFSTNARHRASPHYAQWHDRGELWEGSVTFFSPRSRPGVLLLLDFKTRSNKVVAVRFRPSMVPMHLRVDQPLAVSWEDAGRRLLVRESQRGQAMGVAASDLVATRGPVESDREELRLGIPGRRLKRTGGVLGFALKPVGEDAGGTAEALAADAAALVQESEAHYAALLKAGPVVRSPDPQVNDAIAWGKVSLEQLRVRNPKLGYGLVSGYSSSGTGNRPRYCWFFEEPTLTSWAYHRVGLSSHIKESLLFLQQWQRKDGKTVHEILQSKPMMPDYFETFPYAYMHTDGPVYYLAAYGKYYRETGDLEFIREEWPRIRKTLQWCASMVDKSDGLVGIAEGDWGSAESSTRVWKDTQLEVMWVHALDTMAGLARLMGDKPLAQWCATVGDRALDSIENKFWNEEEGAYVWGLNREGKRLNQLVPHHAIGFWLGRLKPERVRRSLERMAASDVRTDWGVRSLALGSPGYEPGSYQSGSVWPVWNAGVIVADYQNGRSVEGYRNWRAMVALRTLQGSGAMPEVLDAARCQRLPEAVPHQMFSELAVISGFFDGLLGLGVDVPANTVNLAPRIPPTWNSLEVISIPVGQGTIDVDLQTTGRSISGSFRVRYPGGLVVRFQPELPLGARVESVRINGLTVPLNLDPRNTGVMEPVLLPRFEGRTRVSITHSGGVAYMPEDSPLKLGKTSERLRVVSSRPEGNRIRFVVEGLPGRRYPVRFFTEREPVAREGCLLTGPVSGGFRADFITPKNGETNLAGFVRWPVSVQLR